MIDIILLEVLVLNSWPKKEIFIYINLVFFILGLLKDVLCRGYSKDEGY